MKAMTRVATTLMVLLCTSYVYAVQVSIDVQDYPGGWRIHSYTGYFTGNQTVDLQAGGTYYFEAGQHPSGSYGDGAHFKVFADGTIDSLKPESALGGQNSLTIKTLQITIDPANYIGRYFAPGFDQTGSYTYAAMVGIYDRIKFVPGNPGLNGEIIFTVDPVTENISIVNNPDAATLQPGLMTFNTATITIDPAEYTGMYSPSFVDDGDFRRGVEDFVYITDIEYALRFHENQYRSFTVEADGSVSSDDPAFIASGSTLTFNTTPVEFRAGDYQGAYSLAIIDTYWTAGTRTVHLPKGMDWHARIDDRGYIRIHIEDDGNLTSLTPNSGITGPGYVEFLTVPMSLDTNGYIGQFYTVWADDNAHTWDFGDKELNMVKDIEYRIRLGGHYETRFKVNNDGLVVPENPVNLTGGIGTLTLNTTPVTIDPADFEGQWVIDRLPYTNGLQQVVLVKGAIWGLTTYYGKVWKKFAVEADGTLTSLTDGTFDTNGSTLVLRNEYISIEPGPDSIKFAIFGFTNFWTETSTLALVPGFNYSMNGYDAVYPPETGMFVVSEPCSVNPNLLILKGIEYKISCGKLDADDDGVPDETDNCPYTPNGDQLDQDLDGVGNVCDDDIDGDGFLNEADNCPMAENQDQSDLDGDLLGDVCDEDVDGDFVSDTTDNCKYIPNADQADNDLDGIGDVCDEDEDNDLIDDDYDNCPLTQNAGQDDFDLDGEGDACDGDTDNDTVLNEDDLCPGTTGIVPVTDTGCSGSQYIDLLCQKDDFVNHGKYVSCVAHAANDAVELGLITNKEKSRYVSQAAKNK